MKKILITGGAGFIGYFLSQELLALGFEVVGIDDLNDYYDPTLKQARLDQLSEEPKYSFIKLDLADRTCMNAATGLADCFPTSCVARVSDVRV